MLAQRSNGDEPAIIEAGPGADARRFGRGPGAGVAALACLALGLQACATPISGLAPQPPVIERASTLGPKAKDYYAEMATAGAPKDYVAFGYATAYRACTSYFDALIQVQNQAGFSGDVAAAAGTTASSVIALRKDAAGAARDLARIAAGTSFLAAVFASYENRLLMTPYPSETKGLILEAISKYETAAPPGSAADYGAADRLVQGYAELCTYSGITRFTKQALTNARAKDDKREDGDDDGDGAPAVGAPGAPGAPEDSLSPPMIRFN